MGLLRSPLDGLLGSRTKLKLLRVLMPLTRPVALREAARLAGVSPAGALAAFDELTGMGLVERREATSQHMYTLNRDHDLHQVIFHLFEAEDEFWPALLDILQGTLKGSLLRSGAIAAAVFGSRARGDDRPGSDLDLLVITEDEDDEEDLWERIMELQPQVQRQFGMRLSPVILTQERLRQRASEGDPFVDAVASESLPVIKPTIRKLIHGETRKT